VEEHFLLPHTTKTTVHILRITATGMIVPRIIAKSAVEESEVEEFEFEPIIREVD